MKKSSWSSDNNMRRLISLEQFLIILDFLPAKENSGSDILQVLTKSVNLTLDLVGKFLNVGDDDS